MNLRAFVVGLFPGFAARDGDMERIEGQGRKDGRMVATVYANGFRSGMAEVLFTGQQALLGVDEPVDVEPVATCAGRQAPHGRRRRAAMA